MKSLQSMLANGARAFDRAQLASDQSGITLTDLFFARVDLSNLDLTQCEMTGCTAGQIDFTNTDFSNAYLHDGRFEQCDFTNANFEGANLERVVFLRCTFENTKGIGSVELEDVEGFGIEYDFNSLEEEERFIEGHVATNEDLEAAVDAQPDDAGAWAVLGDWWQSEGDIRGELIARASNQREFDSFLEDHREALFSGCDDAMWSDGGQPDLQFKWVNGLPRTMQVMSKSAEGRADLPELLTQAWSLPICRFVTELAVGNVGSADDQPPVDTGALIDAIIRAPGRVHLRSLTLGVHDPDEAQDRSAGDLRRLWSQLPNLESLRIIGPPDRLGSVALSKLKRVDLEIHDASELLRDAITSARWNQGLEHFAFHTRESVALVRLFSSLEKCRLTHFGLQASVPLPDILAKLVQQPWLPSLRVLDLHGSRLTPNNLSAIRSALPRLMHLERFELSRELNPDAQDELLAKAKFFIFRD